MAASDLGPLPTALDGWQPRGLLRSPSLFGSAMQKCKHFGAALASLLVLEATN